MKRGLGLPKWSRTSNNASTKIAVELQYWRRTVAGLGRSSSRYRPLGLGFDRSGPSEIEGHGEFPAANALWNTSTKYRVEMKYPQDITLSWPVARDIKSGTKWIGDEVGSGGPRGFDGSNPAWKKSKTWQKNFGR